MHSWAMETTVVSKQLSWSKYPSKYSNTIHTTIATDTEYFRLANSTRYNPKLTCGAREFLFNYGENALALQGVSDPVSGGCKHHFSWLLVHQRKTSNGASSDSHHLISHNRVPYPNDTRITP